MKWADSLPRARRPNLPFDKLIADIRALYPECSRIFVAGSYARNEMHTHSDVDIVIELPAELAKKFIHIRDDRPLWRKWNAWRTSGKPKFRNRARRAATGRGVTIDFIVHYIGGHHVGQHEWRTEQGLPTPEIDIWKR